MRRSSGSQWKRLPYVEGQTGILDHRSLDALHLFLYMGEPAYHCIAGAVHDERGDVGLGHQSTRSKRLSASSTRSSPETSLGSSPSRRAARVRDSESLCSIAPEGIQARERYAARHRSLELRSEIHPFPSVGCDQQYFHESYAFGLYLETLGLKKRRAKWPEISSLPLLAGDPSVGPDNIGDPSESARPDPAAFHRRIQRPRWLE